MSRASGLGSWPGTSAQDFREALRVVRDTMSDDSRTDVPGIAYLPEMPGRGPGADMIGRTAGMLVELHVDLQPSGWRLVDRQGRDVRQARSGLRADLDELAEAYDGWEGDLKIQVAGPWTLAAQLRVARGERVVGDAGACREVTASLAEGLRLHLAEVRRLVPGARLVAQLDEPLLPAVLAGELATSSGFGRLRAIDPEDARIGLREVVDAARTAGAAETVVHSCAPGIPFTLLHQAGADGVSVDVALLGEREWESIAVCVEAGVRLWAGALPTDDLARPATVVAHDVERPWRALGLHPGLLDGVVLTPACGLAGATPAGATGAHRTLVEAAAELTEASTR